MIITKAVVANPLGGLGMPTGTRLFVWGNLACFTRPETKVERFSYPMPTPSVCRNILDAICWRPEMRWIIQSVSLARHPEAPQSSPIALPRTITLKRNEVQSTIAPGSVSHWMRDPSRYRPLRAGPGEGLDGTPRMTVALKNVAYIIEAYPHVFDDNRGRNTARKYVAMLERRAMKGQCYSQPYFGCREFVAAFRLATAEDQTIPLNADLGRMLYDIAVTPEGRKAVFFDALLVNGVMNTVPQEVLLNETSCAEVLACSYKR